MIKVFNEKEFISETLQVRGFADTVIIEDGKVYVYDIKTINAWAYKMRFGRSVKKKGSIHQELQVATYGVMAEQEYGSIDGIFLIYYNKDNSHIKILEVDRDKMLTAIGFWNSIKDEHKNGLPQLKKGVSPAMDWECRYCSYKTQCDKDKLKGE